MKLKYLIYTITLTSLTACSDFLEPKSQSKYIPKDANALQEMLIGEAYPQQGNTKFLAYLEILADDIDQNQVEGYEFPENEQGKMETFEVLYSWQPNMFEMQQKLGQEPSNTWGNLYEYILGANAALDYTDEVSGTEAEKNYIKAQSYALRAFFYYMLVNQYGLPYNYDKESLGVPLKIDSKMRDEGEVLMKRNTVEEVTRKYGMEYSASAVGEVNVVTKMKATNAVIGGEGNGGVIYPASHYGRDALVGIALFLSHLAHEGKKVSELRATYPPYFIAKNRVDLTPEIDVDAILAKVKEIYKNEEINDIDGVKIDFADKWVHLRKSNTEPIIRVYSEASTMEAAEEIGQKIMDVINELAK